MLDFEKLPKESEPASMKHLVYLVSAILGIVAAIPVSEAADGDVLRCTVSDFVNTSDTGDAEFIEANRKKVFEIHERPETYLVLTSSSKFKPGTDIYRITRTGMLQISATGERSSFSDTLTIDTNRDDLPIKASIALQAPDFLNVWFLSCLPTK